MCRQNEQSVCIIASMRLNFLLLVRQESLSKSNQAFADFKKESEKMQKKLRTVEKEKRELTAPLQKVNAQVKDATVRERIESSILMPFFIQIWTAAETRSHRRPVTSSGKSCRL
jgi:hypothetical protein